MEVQVAGRVMADMFDDKHVSGIIRASQHGPTLWHLKTRVEVAWRSELRMLSNDTNRQNVGFGRK